jgi:nucleoid DNA-binding protein
MDIAREIDATDICTLLVENVYGQIDATVVETVTLPDLLMEVSTRLNVTKSIVSKVISAYLNYIRECLKQGKHVEIPEFGTFEAVGGRAKRKGHAKITQTIAINDVAEETKAAKHVVQQIVDTFLDVIRESLENGATVKIRGFGTFEVKGRD